MPDANTLGRDGRDQQSCGRRIFEVSAARPDTFRPDLDRSLHNLSNRLADLGRPQDALAAGEEAVTIRRELATRWPDAYHHELQQSLRVVACLQHR
jgi:hypothetical protein